MKRAIQLMSIVVLGMIMVACSSSSANFDPEEEKKKATEVMEGVLTSFEDQEKLAEGATRDESNQIAWDKIKEKNSDALSDDLSNEEEKRLLYILTVNKAEDTANGGTKSNLHFNQNTKIKDTIFNEEDKTFNFDIEMFGVDNEIITLKKQEDAWKITKVTEPE
ncbi:hypothetical protein [Mesobacillus foraminis]|uniref:DUF4878 domain-containing protein n=2 Tax=Mesobacillus foraminis TaxID=279826 RepID=A0A4R2AXE8_9BACI|nr:hypothetical protein [Mesobacillus foraminis]TCN18453.1 hypothetical protein EV146_12052 [Mesobacillus foraminis]